MNHLHYEESNTTSDELFVLQLLAKQELFRRNHDVNILLSGLYDMVRYLEIKKCAPSSSNELRAYLEVLMQSVCIPFFRVVVRGLSFDRNNFKKIIQILQTITEQYKGESHEFYFPRFAVEKFTSYGMSEFCVLWNYEKQKENNLYDAFAILKGEKHTYLYRFGDGSFVASTDTSFMDHWNIYRSCSLVGSVRCQLVIKPYSSIAMDSISQYVDILKRRISSEVVAAVEFDNVVNIHFPRNTSSCTLSRVKLNGQKDLIQHPIHKYIAIMIE
uniref:Uncharacterized protein n=1 Tax=Babesia bovis TaxID=5865 RepID=S6BEZ7_BABBO|nr:hypothetical protein [Babesia bovis]